MRQSKQKNKKHTAHSIEHRETQKQSAPLRWRIFDVKPVSSSSLETSHRLSWRRYALSLALSFLCFVFCVGSIYAEPKASADSQLPSTDMISKEGQKQTLAKKQEMAKKKVLKKIEMKKADLPDVDANDEKAEGAFKSVKGIVSARNNYGVAVEYGVDPVRGELEMWASLNSKTKLSGIKKMSELQEGDTVEVRYKELDNGKKIFSDVALIQRKPKEEAETVPQLAPVAPKSSANKSGVTV